MSLEAFGDSDEGWEDNPTQQMFDALIARGLVWECLCHYRYALNGKPCPQCGTTPEEYALYRPIIDAYVATWDNRQSGRHWMIFATEAVRSVIMAPASQELRALAGHIDDRIGVYVDQDRPVTVKELRAWIERIDAVVARLNQKG